MKRVIWKTTWREICQSKGRFLAILAIIALGVGLFAGLKVTKPFIINMADNYLAESNFYDFKLLSDYGFEEQDVDFLADREGVRAVSGSYTYDLLCRYSAGDTTEVLKIHSIPEAVNGMKVLYGRMPENSMECVADSRAFDEKTLGQVLHLAPENEKDTLDAFAETAFTIVGVVNASEYIQYERGNTSVGSGTVAGYLYVLPEAFDSEVFTEVYVKFEQDFPLYSEEYDLFIEQKEEVWKGYLEEASANRFNRIRNEALLELADAKAEFAEEKADAESELADAFAELTNAALEIEDAKQKIQDAEKEISDAYEEIAQKEKELLDGEAELSENEDLLRQSERELEEGIAEWHSNKQIVDDGKKALQQNKTALAEQENNLILQENTLIEQERLFEQTLSQFTPAQLEAYQAVIEEKRAMFAAGKAEINAGKGQIAVYKASLQEAEHELDAADAKLMSAWSDIENGQGQIADAWEQIDEGKLELADGRVKIAEAKRELTDAEQELKDAREELAEGEAEYLDGLREYEEGLAEFEEEIADAEAEIADAQKDIDELEAPKSYLLDRGTNVGYACLENDSKVVEDVADVFPVFFFLVAALVCMTTMNRMIDEQRTQIGVYKALGYNNSAIMAKYLTYSGVAALIGCVVGFLGGTYVLPKVIWTAYGMMYDMENIDYYVDWGLAVISVTVALLCSMGTTWYSCRQELKEVAAVLMRPKAPKAGKRVLLERIPFIWKRLKFLHKVSIRNVLRYKKRFFMMVIGISGCTALLVAGFGIMDSIKGVVSRQFREVQLYDMSVTFRSEPARDTYQEFETLIADKVNHAGRFMESAIDITANDIMKTVSLLVPENTEEVSYYLGLRTLEGESISFPGQGEAVITHKMAELLGLTTGDAVTLTDEELNSTVVTISAVCRNYVGNYIFLHPDTCAHAHTEAEYKTVLLDVSDEVTDQHLFAAELLGMDEVVNVTVNNDVQLRFENMMSSMNYVVFVIILCAAALAFIVLFNLTNINITERVREIATIKVLGFFRKETSAYVFRENVILTAVGAAAGLFLGKIFHAFIMNCIKLEAIAFGEQISIQSYLYSFAMTFLFAWLVNCFMIGKINRISMTESLKSVD